MANFITPTCTPEAANDAAGTVVGTFITAVNEICDSHQVDTMALLRKSKYYRQDIKRYFNLARQAMQKSISYARLHLRPEYHDYYYTYVDYCSDEMAKHINTLYFSILQALTEKQVEDRQLIAMLETDRVLLGLAIQAFDELFHDIQVRTAYDLYQTYEPYRPSACFHNWDRGMQLILERQHGPSVDLNQCKDAKLAFEIIQKKLVNASFLDKASEKTIEELGAIPKPQKRNG